MENKTMLLISGGVIALIILAVVVVGGASYLLDEGGQEATKIQFSEYHEEGKQVVEVTVQEYDRQGHFEVVVNTEKGTESETVIDPKPGGSVVVGDELESGLSTGQKIEIIEVRSEGGVIMDYTVTGTNNEETQNA